MEAFWFIRGLVELLMQYNHKSTVWGIFLPPKRLVVRRATRPVLLRLHYMLQHVGVTHIPVTSISM